jgi:hypothetical protein
MARISGVTIPNDKQIWVALTYVYGIGPKTADDILEAAKVERTVRTKDLTDAEVARIQDFINENYTVEGELQRERQHQAPEGHQGLPWYAPRSEPSGPRPAHQDQRAYPPWSQSNGWWHR